MSWVGQLVETVSAAGPWAGWTVAALGLLGTVWLYATDRLVSHGRHVEQATHYEQRLQQQSENHQVQMDQLRATMQALAEQEHARAEAYLEDRNYWRDGLLDLMNATAAAVGREDQHLSPPEVGER